MDSSDVGRDSGATFNGPLAPTKTPSKKSLLKELSEVLKKNNALREQVANLSGFGSDWIPASSSMGHTDGPLLSAMSSWSLGALNIPECVPSEGQTEIDKQAFEYWKDMLVSSLQLANATDERMKYGVFKIKFGPKLREILSTTSSTPEMPDEQTSPFSNALARLDGYYGSRAYTLTQRGKLMMMLQGATENSIAFVRRVTCAAKLCGYGPDEEMEAVVRVITQRANDARVRTLANRNWLKQGTMKDLIDLIQDHEIEKSSEEEFLRRQRLRDSPLVAAVSHSNEEYRNQRTAFSSYGRGRGFPNRGGGRGGRGFSRGNNRSQSNCWRCGSVYHRSSECFAIKKDCRICRQYGHIARCCPSNQSSPLEQRRPLKRHAEEEETTVERKIAAIECAKTEADPDPKVQNIDDLE
ncbi:uncharacterized protein LOC134291246 isoform X2 [Aedes albopictus]|uniref:CCHC-type domain-containing protein n=1 Tax=Aedes albopictus TaxID=7160 RepID=A0ABM1Z7U4_AEDAL